MRHLPCKYTNKFAKYQFKVPSIVNATNTDTWSSRNKLWFVICFNRRFHVVTRALVPFMVMSVFLNIYIILYLIYVLAFSPTCPSFIWHHWTKTRLHFCHAELTTLLDPLPVSKFIWTAAGCRWVRLPVVVKFLMAIDFGRQRPRSEVPKCGVASRDALARRFHMSRSSQAYCRLQKFQGYPVLVLIRRFRWCGNKKQSTVSLEDGYLKRNVLSRFKRNAAFWCALSQKSKLINRIKKQLEYILCSASRVYTR